MHGDKREYGDYQTPIEFADKVCKYLSDFYHVKPSIVIEPTCGMGNFLKSSLMFNANQYYGIEINSEYCNICENSIKDDRVKIINCDFFSFSFKKLIKFKEQVLVIGNPPWVTNSALSAMDSENLPLKSNFKDLKGFDAITGASNFDICEYIILRLISEYKDTNTIISMLCKTSVARNVFKELKRNLISFTSYDILEFDASSIFGVGASACILVIALTDQKTSLNLCNVYDFDNHRKIKKQFGFIGEHFYSNFCNNSCDYDGQSCFEWRQGVKHDCSKIMELSLDNDVFHNSNNEYVQIEDDIVYPLIKSSMFKLPIIHSFSKYVIVTQKKIREDTLYIKKQLPKTWRYLNDNIQYFEKRKSSIYRGAPAFSMFGIGEYSYSKYKVGVSGFYKRPLFSVLYSDNGKPVMLDDTSYFICFDSFDYAYVAMLLLNSNKVQNFLSNIAFLDAKRPYTKKVLERIDFRKIVDSLNIEDLKNTEQQLELNRYINTVMYDSFKAMILNLK